MLMTSSGDDAFAVAERRRRPRDRRRSEYRSIKLDHMYSAKLRHRNPVLPPAEVRTSIARQLVKFTRAPIVDMIYLFGISCDVNVCFSFSNFVYHIQICPVSTSESI